jgi:mRNA interferase MazF
MRPAVVLTREIVRPHLQRITVAPVTSTIRGLSTEVPVGALNGLHQDSVVSCDNITTIDVSNVGEHIGYLLPDQEAALTEAIRIAYDLE